jgi:DNA-binding MarR family transcriptional regulator
MPVTQPSDPALLAETLRPALLRVSRRLRQEAKKVGVSALDALLLGQILLRPGGGGCDLADEEQISRPTLSSHVKRLEAAGWITRLTDAEDARRSGLTITEAGREALEAIRRQRNDWLAARLSRLSPEARQALSEAAAPLLQLLAVEA